MIPTLALCCLLTGDPPPSRLAVIRTAPDFTLLNQDGKTTKLSDYQGKIVVVSFVFTTCSGACPATTHRLAKVRAALDERRPARPVVFLTITLDPERDTPEALRRYIKLYDLPPDWTFVTGQPPAVAKTIEAWGMWVKPTANGQLDHPSRIFLVDQKQRIREVYNVDMLRTAEVLEDIDLLWREGPK
jgi:protein SCO1/2